VQTPRHPRHPHEQRRDGGIPHVLRTVHIAATYIPATLASPEARLGHLGTCSKHSKRTPHAYNRRSFVQSVAIWSDLEAPVIAHKMAPGCRYGHGTNF
jgi:hypothetical protein